MPDLFRRYDFALKHELADRSPDGSFLIRSHKGPPMRMEGALFYFDGEHIDHYGHFTLEVPSCLWCFRDVDLTALKFVTSCTNANLLSAALAPFGIAPSSIARFNHAISCERLFISSQSYVLEGCVSPNAFRVWDHIRDFYKQPGGTSRIYVSRSRWPQQRRLLNEMEVEAIFQESGFEIIHPESMSFGDQVSVFANAEIVAGPSGSGLYNCVYCPSQCTKIILASERFVTANDALIHSKGQGDLIYITGPTEADPRGSMFANWHIDTDVVRSTLVEMVMK